MRYQDCCAKIDESKIVIQRLINQRLLYKDCVAKIVTQRLLRKGEDFYGVNLSQNLVPHLS